MKKELGIFTGKTVKDACAQAEEATGKKIEELVVEVLEEGKKGGIFGIGAQDAKILVSEEIEDKTDGQRAVEFLTGLMKLLHIEAQPVLEREEEKIEISLNATDSHEVIGKRGATLDAIQNLAGAIANIGRDKYKRVVVDCENYREKREETLRRVAVKTAEKAVRQGRKISLEPMSAYERRIIHSALADSTEVKTVSEGKEPRRFVVVVPNELKPYRAGDKGRRRFNDRESGRGPRGGRGKEGRDRERESGYSRRPRREYTEEEKQERSRVGGGTGFGAKSDYSYKKTSSVVFGTFLGNSRDAEKPAEPVAENTEKTEE